ncbi:uncharacterized protein FA14DRAFT_142678 [Meira miltonrushii]|uniref:GTP-binding protein n=1 Tax=Meira miltonrushii TaxID=1280837 RepID=A0A316VR29_9BASI|nr:uncharacterized protein FA14DRAFT_142678 [Meira miltonrushii]PWN37955.1 hypothetical protein FA14DRAFT_142678 [Meira miltonrushii]
MEASGSGSGQSKSQTLIENILILGLRRSGKSSIVEVVYKSLPPDDSLFLESTLKCTPFDVNTIQPVRIWDGTGNAESSALTAQQSQGSQARTSKSAGNGSGQSSGNTTKSVKGKHAWGTGGQLFWVDTSAVIFVIDSQDDFYDAIDRLNDVIIDAYSHNPLIQFHIFVHKVDGHSTDYRYDTLQNIQSRVCPAHPIPLVHMNQTLLLPLFGPDLERDVRLSFHATSIYNPSVFVAVSRVQMGLMNSDVSRTLEDMCNGLAHSCKFEKVYLFDVPTKTYISADSSPYDENNFEAISEYLNFLVQFSGLYGSLANEQIQKESDKGTDREVRYSASIVRLSPDTTLGFHQINHHMALAFIMRTDIHTKHAGMIDFNIAIARKAIIDIYDTCRS